MRATTEEIAVAHVAAARAVVDREGDVRDAQAALAKAWQVLVLTSVEKSGGDMDPSLRTKGTTS